MSKSKCSITAKDKDGKFVRVKLTDERLKSGELMGITTGKTIARDSNGIISHVDKDDPRLASGELQYVLKGKTAVRDKYGKVHRVSVDDERIKSGEFTNIHKNMVTVKDIHGTISKVHKDDPRYKSGILISNKGVWCIIEGETISASNASKKYKVNLSTVHNRCKSKNPDFKEWNYRLNQN